MSEALFSFGLIRIALLLIVVLGLSGTAGEVAARTAAIAPKGTCDPAPIPLVPDGPASSFQLSRLGQGFSLTVWRFECDETFSFVILTVEPDAGSEPFVCSASFVVQQGGQTDPLFKLTRDPAGAGASQCGDVTGTTSFALIPRTTSVSGINSQDAMVVNWDFGGTTQTIQVPAFVPGVVDPGVDALTTEAGVTGIFFDPNTPGHGFNFNFGASGLTIFYFGHTVNGERLWLTSETVALDLRFDTPEVLTLYEVVDGTFGMPINQLDIWGTLTLNLTDCDRGQVMLAGVDGVQTLNVVRLSGVLGLGCDGGPGQ